MKSFRKRETIPNINYNCSLKIILTLNQPGSGKSVNYRGPISFDLAFTRWKLTSPGIWLMCNRALWFQKFTQNSRAVLLYLERARNGPLGTCLPTALYTARDKKFIGMLPDVAPHCGPQPSRTSQVLGWSVMTVSWSEAGRSAGSRCDRTSDKKTSKWMSIHNFLMSCQKFKKICKMFYRNRSILKKSDLQEFCLEFDVKVSEVYFDLAWLNEG